ncbi:MAG: terminase family protein, partial [Rikenellaceae bacterium]
MVGVRPIYRAGRAEHNLQLERVCNIPKPLHKPMLKGFSGPSLLEFASRVMPSFQTTPLHNQYYKILEEFLFGKASGLIVSMPPQHGKSLASSVLLPAYALGHFPDMRIALASYNSSFASKFNKRIQRIIDNPIYAEMFPETTLKGRAQGSLYLRTAEEFEIVNHQGSLLTVGREGSITGNPVDLFIIDDLYKDMMEASSPIIRENCWEWYNSVVKTRLHNNSRELIVSTRWHEEDLIGRICNFEKVANIETMAQISNKSDDGWFKLCLEAIKDSPSTEVDPRTKGQALWPERHSIKLLEKKRKYDNIMFEALYQGRPTSRDGLLYGDNMAIYDNLPSKILKYANYTDTADMGEDYLCSICYVVDDKQDIYITDMVFTQQSMEHTEGAVAAMLARTRPTTAYIESN